jgi:nucleoside-diphosphate-sugar epimerase
MGNILVTGSSGFVGMNLLSFFKKSSILYIPYSRNIGSDYNLINTTYLDEKNVESIIHLAGIAHDVKNHTNDELYFTVNTELTIKLFNSFLNSNTNTFIYLSSIKAVKDFANNILTEQEYPTPKTAYGRSKLEAENFMLQYELPIGKRLIILRPSVEFRVG